MRAVVTGGSGFIGSNIVKQLLSEGWEVYYTGREDENLPGGKCLGYSFTDFYWSSVDPVDALFHQAAITDTLKTNGDEMMGVNCYGTLRLFQNAIAHGCKNIVYASSCAVYGDVPVPFREEGPFKPLNVYGTSKLVTDMLVFNKLMDAKIIGLRYSNVYGPGEEHKGRMASMVRQLAQQMMSGQRPKLFEFGQQSRDFVYIKDVVAANMQSLKTDVSGVFNCGSGVASSFNDIVSHLNELLGTNLETEYIKNPVPAAYQNVTLCDMSKAKEVLGHEPKWMLKEGIKDYIGSLLT